MKSTLSFFQHDLGEAELDSIRKVFAGPILTTGEFVHAFEIQFADYMGAKTALGVMSCTAALELSLFAMGIGHGDEVITTPLTFVATSEAIVNSGAKPIFVDVEADTGNMDASLIERAITPRTKAIIAVHLYGLMCDMRKIRRIADKHHLKVIEDAAHCIEGLRDGIRVGQLADVACYSFFATKNIACGEGGAVSTNDLELYERMKRLRTHGMNKTASDRHKEGYKHWDVPESGMKCNMSNIEAAILLPQLARIDRNHGKRIQLAERFFEVMKDENQIRWPATRPETVHSRHLFTVWVKTELRDRVIARLQEDGVPVVVNYRPVHLLSWYRETFGFKPADFPVANEIGSQTISLPFYPNMPLENVDIIVKTLSAAIAAETGG